MQIYIHHNNQQIGPFTEAEVKAQLAAGTISLQDHVWWQGQQDWVPLSQTALGGGGTPVTPGAPPTPAITSPAGIAVQPTSKLALWSLICGCASLFCSILTGIPAIILGHMGLKEIKKNPGMQGGGMAQAGLILGYIFTLLLPIISIIAISVLIALGNQVKGTFKTIEEQAKAEQSTNSADQSATNSDQTTNAPDQNTPTATPTNSPDQSTNSAPTNTNAPDQSTNSSTSSTNAPDSSLTNAAPMSQ
jgi:Domain of unknown function (DUF4190)/GYF domain 2